MGRLLVSVRGPNEALAAAQGGTRPSFTSEDLPHAPLDSRTFAQEPVPA